MYISIFIYISIYLYLSIYLFIYLSIYLSIYIDCSIDRQRHLRGGGRSARAACSRPGTIALPAQKYLLYQYKSTNTDT